MADIALLMDFESVAIAAYEAGLGMFRPGLVVQRLAEGGRVTVRRAYADLARYQVAREPLHTEGFQLVDTSGSSDARLHLVLDAMDLCHRLDHLDVFAIATADAEVGPLITRLRERGKQVVGIGLRDTGTASLFRMCDETMYYATLVEESRLVAH